MNKPPFGGFFIANSIKQISIENQSSKTDESFYKVQKELNRNYLISFWIENFKSTLTTRPVMIKSIPMYEFKDSAKILN